MKEWVAVERSMISYGWPLDLDLRLKVMTIAFMSVAAGIFHERMIVNICACYEF